jgi:hypothetical protein
MIDITITPLQLSYSSSVMGLFSAQYQRDEIEIVDDFSIHISTDRGVLLFNVDQYSFNGLSFTNSIDAIAFILSI